MTSKQRVAKFGSSPDKRKESMSEAQRALAEAQAAVLRKLIGAAA